LAIPPPAADVVHVLSKNVQANRTGLPPLVKSPAPKRQEVFPLNQQEVSVGLP
jgi:hypothetical protein